MEKENIITLDLQEERISYKVYLPFKETDYIQRTIWNTKAPYEYEILQAMLERIPKDSLVLDIGMNIANHSLFFAANGLKVIAFEANPKMSAIAKKSVALNNFEDRICICEFGLSDREEERHYARETPSNYGGMSLSKGKSSSGEGIVCKTLDSLEIQEKVYAIKIDIESMESYALKGGRKLIMKNRPIIYAEANSLQDFVKLERVLESMDYVHWDTFGSSLMHLYLPQEQVSEKQILAKNAAKLALESLCLVSGRKHSNWTNNILERVNKEVIKHTATLESTSRAIQKQQEILRGILFSTATARTQSHLAYKLGQVLIKDSKSFNGILKLPFKILSLYYKHNKEQKQSQEQIKKNPYLKLPPLKSYADYKEALKIQNYFSYKLGKAFIESYSVRGGGGISCYLLPLSLSKKCVS